MGKSKKPSNEEEVSAYFGQLDYPLIEVVSALRQIVLSTDQEIGEQIKWNSLSFYYTGAMQAFDPKDYKRDLVVFNLRKKDFVLLVFPTGASIDDRTGLLEGNFPDGRKIIKFATLAEVQNRKDCLQIIIKEWLKLLDK